ncbi:TlpA disulfide reductase family protein [Telluribacter sp. SYSU D00476]|uniref:TlpA disulfide reductase family protein n=1 Tax=Telluribacter sp. SYSU D00476 TaxID=2811430 RepID=UPI001FF6B583|nr:TlpA disulfide reductase family protein [Telluribacter sp. SYSU D00476]
MKMLPLFQLLALLVVVLACSKHRSEVVIRGDIKDLPAGELLLRDLGTWRTIDSVQVVDGTFTFSIPADSVPQPRLVMLSHRDSLGIITLLTFKTGKIHKGKPTTVDVFMLEDGLQISGSYAGSYKIHDNVHGMKQYLTVTSGRQTMVMYNDTANFPMVKKISQLKELVSRHPYSYYYLYELERRVGRLDNDQFFTVFNRFEEEVKESPTGRELRQYVESRNSKKLDFATVLPDIHQQPKAVLDKDAAIHVVVLWASWCGPCRREIPQLKRVYQAYSGNKAFRMVSISIDESTQAWEKAVAQEQMPWDQLLMTAEAKTYARELFSFDRAVPVTLFIDGKGKLIRKMVGYDEGSQAVYDSIITRSLIQQPVVSLR